MQAYTSNNNIFFGSKNIVSGSHKFAHLAH